MENFHKNKNYFRLILSDDKIDQRLLNKFELKHLICKTCAINKNIENEDDGYYDYDSDLDDEK